MARSGQATLARNAPAPTRSSDARGYRARRALLIGLGRPQRWTLAVAAALTAAITFVNISPSLDEAAYMGALFIVLTSACSVLAVAALVRDTAVVYYLSILTCGLTIIGYTATRLVAFPLLADDVGNWLEPLGVASVIAEAVVVGCAVAALRPRPWDGVADRG